MLIKFPTLHQWSHIYHKLLANGPAHKLLTLTLSTHTSLALWLIKARPVVLLQGEKQSVWQVINHCEPYKLLCYHAFRGSSSSNYDEVGQYSS